jgi:hypothetical protein
MMHAFNFKDIMVKYNSWWSQWSSISLEWCDFKFLRLDLRYWVKPRSITWFFQFLLLMEMKGGFIILKWQCILFNIVVEIQPLVEKQNTKYWLIIPLKFELLVQSIS